MTIYDKGLIKAMEDKPLMEHLSQMQWIALDSLED